MGFPACGGGKPSSIICPMKLRAARVSIVWILLPALWLAYSLHAGGKVTDASSKQTTSEPTVAEFTPQQFQKLCRLLSDEYFNVRQNAENELHRLLHLSARESANPVETACYEEWSHTPDPEVRARLESVLTDYATNLWGPKPFLGIAVIPEKSFNEVGELVLQLRVQSVAKSSPAEKSGLKEGDFLRAIGDVQLEGQADASKMLIAFLEKKQPGDPVVLSVTREGKTEKKPVILGHSPWVQANANPDKPMPPPDPKQCFREYLKKKAADR